MSLINCKECGHQISSEANFCPYCGFKNSLDNVVKFQVLNENDSTNLMTIDNNKKNRKLVDFFTNIEILKGKVPELAAFIQEQYNSEPKLVVKMSDFIKSKIEDGSYSLMFDQDGDILPCIKNTKTNKIVKQFRLKSESIPNEFASTFLSVQTHAIVQELLVEIKEARQEIQNLHKEMQSDRYARAESAFMLFKMAEKINDPELKKNMYVGAITQATDAKCTLINNFELLFSQLKTIKNAKKGDECCADVINDLRYILLTEIIECRGLSQMDENEAVITSITDFNNFISKNRLADHQVLVLINGYSQNNKDEVLKKIESNFKTISKQKLLLEDTHKKLKLIENNNLTI